MVTTLYNSVASIGGFVRSFTERASDQAHQPFQSRMGFYELQEAYYGNSLFETIDQRFASYRSRYQLPRRIRPIYNPTRRAVDFYPGHIYPTQPDGDELAVPFASGTDEPLMEAAKQALMWGNWPHERYAYVRTGAKLGDVFVVVRDDLARGKVYPKIVWPGYVDDLAFNDSGDVLSYALEYRAEDDQKRAYTYRLEVDRNEFRTFKDGQPFPYEDTPAIVVNPYGFVPAVWVQHRNVGGQHGAPVIDGVHGKIDQLNSTAAAIHDYIGKFVNQGVVFKSAKDPAPVFGAKAKAGATDEFGFPPAGREDIEFFRIPPDAEIDRLVQNLGLAEAEHYLDSLIEEIENDLPEIIMNRELRGKPEVTGPGADRMMSDVAHKVAEAQGNYDAGLRKLMQMCVTIGGWRASTTWPVLARGGLTRQQEKFRPFALDSFARGDTDMDMKPRPLIAETEIERLNAAMLKKSLGWTEEQLQEDLGVDTKVIARMKAERDARRQEQAALFGGEA